MPTHTVVQRNVTRCVEQAIHDALRECRERRCPAPCPSPLTVNGKWSMGNGQMVAGGDCAREVRGYIVDEHHVRKSAK